MDLDIFISPLFGLINFALAIFGLIVGYILFLKSRRLKEPCWAMRTINLIQGIRAQLSDLEVRFREEPVENLSISRIAFWNQGAETIERSHIPASSPLQVVAKGEIRLLDARVLQTNHPSGNFSVQLDDAGMSALLGFDFCDVGQGVVLQIVHTGTGQDDVELRGNIKGARTPARRETVPSGPMLIAGAGIVVGGGMIGVSAMEPNTALDPFLIALGIILLFGAAFTAGKYWRNRLPRGLDLFEDVPFGILKSAGSLKPRHSP